MRVIVTLMIIDHVRDEDILEEEDIIRIEMEGHQIEKITKKEDIQEEEDPHMMEDPLMMEDPQDDGGPPNDGGPLTMEDPRKWKTAEKTWKTRTTRTSWTSAPYNCTTTPGYFRYYCSGKYIRYSWSVNVTIG